MTCSGDKCINSNTYTHTYITIQQYWNNTNSIVFLFRTCQIKLFYWLCPMLVQCFWLIYIPFLASNSLAYWFYSFLTANAVFIGKSYIQSKVWFPLPGGFTDEPNIINKYHRKSYWSCRYHKTLLLPQYLIL